MKQQSKRIAQKTMGEYENLINFLKQALLFYGDEENYNRHNMTTSPIELDKGHQARFALKQINIIDKVIDEMEEEMLRHFPEELENSDIKEDFLKAIEELKKFDIN